MKALQVFAGPRALAHLHAMAGRPRMCVPFPAAGGPKGLTLLPLDRFLFGEWLPKSAQTVDLIGASIGAWRMAAAMLDQPAAALAALEHAYIRQDYDVPPGRKAPTREHISERFAAGIHAMFGQRVPEVLSHPRYRLRGHIRGRHILHRDNRLRSPLGYAGAFFTNIASRRPWGLAGARGVLVTPGYRRRAAVRCQRLPDRRYACQPPTLRR